MARQTRIPKNGIRSFVRVTAANTSSEGGGTIATDIFLVGTVDATNGSYINFVRITARSATAATTMTQSCVRVFTSTQSSGVTTSANTNLLVEKQMPVMVADATVIPTWYFDVPVMQWIPAGLSILATSHQALAVNTVIGVEYFGGDF
jgi:predicted benzoate:H+ symporter BenE